MTREILSVMRFPSGGILRSGEWSITREPHAVLWCNRNEIMEDSEQELAKNVTFCEQASGNVLIGGLGLECIVRGLLLNPKITYIDVIEISEDVIKLVGPTVENEKVKIHNIDGTKQILDGKWDFAWWDFQSEEKDVGMFKPIHLEIMQKYKDKVGCQMVYDMEGFQLENQTLR